VSIFATFETVEAADEALKSNKSAVIVENNVAYVVKIEPIQRRMNPFQFHRRADITKCEIRNAGNTSDFVFVNSNGERSSRGRMPFQGSCQGTLYMCDTNKAFDFDCKKLIEENKLLNAKDKPITRIVRAGTEERERRTADMARERKRNREITAAKPGIKQKVLLSYKHKALIRVSDETDSDDDEFIARKKLKSVIVVKSNHK
jgi:hypothetical protein